jgi:hypothetical protein
VDQARVRVRGTKHMLTNSRHTTGIRHAPRQWYFIHPVIMAGTVSAPITTTSDAGCWTALSTGRRKGGRRWSYNSCARIRPALQGDGLSWVRDAPDALFGAVVRASRRTDAPDGAYGAPPRRVVRSSASSGRAELRQ